MKEDIKNGIKLVHIDVDQMQVFGIINNVGIMINADVNVNNRLTKKDVMKDLYGSQVTVNVNVINHVILDNIQIVNIVNLEKC